jgi:LysM repeat protein
MIKKVGVMGLMVCLLGLGFAPVQAAPLQAPNAYEVIAAVNALRASYGLAPYAVDGLLMISAQGQADYLAAQYPNVVDGHTGPGGTDADARAKAVGFPYISGLDINENWASLGEDDNIDTLIYQAWGDEVHMHTMLHPHGQLVGMGVASNNGQYYYVLDVAAYWGDAGLTQQPTTLAYGEGAATQQYISQYIAPLIKVEPAADGSITHTVQSGQSLWMIAIHYGVKIDDLRKLNHLGSGDTIYIGQKILVREPQPMTPTGTAPEMSAESKPSSNVQAPTPFTALAIQTEGKNGLNLRFDQGLWFLIFFGLFALGLILIVLGTSGH